MTACKRLVTENRVAIPRDFFGPEVSYIFGRTPRPELGATHAFPGSEKRSRREHRVGFDHAAIHHDSAEAHEAAIFQRTSMDDRLVPNQAVRPDLRGMKTRRDMDDRAVLDVGAGADRNALDVASQHAIIPDRRLGPDRYPPDDPASGRDEYIVAEARLVALEGKKMHVAVSPGSSEPKNLAGLNVARKAAAQFLDDPPRLRDELGIALRQDALAKIDGVFEADTNMAPREE